MKKRIKSFKYAFNGLRILFREESNAWIHLCIAFCVLIAGFVLQISKGEWIVIIFCIGFVFALELVNTAIENIADFVSKDYHVLIKKAKDLSAGAVLIGAIVSAVVGFIIFVPRIIGLLY
jgi:diacylglycerol kinase